MATATPPASPKVTYPAEAVNRLFAPPESEVPADKLRRLLLDARDRGTFLHTAGAYDAFTAAIMTTLGFKTLYGSGWQLDSLELRREGGGQLRAFAHARDDGFDFERREVLRFVDDHVLVGDAAAADVTEGLDDHEAGADQVVAAAMFVAHVQVAEQLKRVVDGLHPGSEFLLERAGEEAELAAH